MVHLLMGASRPLLRSDDRGRAAPMSRSFTGAQEEATGRTATVVTVRYFAAARAAADGLAEEQMWAASLGELIDQISARYGSRMEGVLRVSTLLVDGATVRDASYSLVTSEHV